MLGMGFPTKPDARHGISNQTRCWAGDFQPNWMLGMGFPTKLDAGQGISNQTGRQKKSLAQEVR